MAFIAMLTTPRYFKRFIKGFQNQQIYKKIRFNYKKLNFHNFIQNHTWNKPIVLFTEQDINVMNTLFSMAQYFDCEVLAFTGDKNGMG